MGFGPCSFFLKIQESIWTPTPKLGALIWERGGSFTLTFSHFHTLESMKCDYRASLLARTFARPCFGHEPKARVATSQIKIVHRKLYDELSTENKSGKD
jgi:hypothetical protein